MSSHAKRGEITTFLSLTFLLILSLVGAVIESASIQILKNQRRADMSLAMENIFAEYHKEILEKYDIFALDISYGSGSFETDRVTRRLMYYGMDNVQMNVEKSEFLTDSGGKAFYEQAIRYVENKYGMEGMGYEETELSSWWEQKRKTEDYQEKEGQVNEQLDSMLEEVEGTLPSENNPMQSVADIKKLGLLQVVVDEPETISSRAIQIEQLPSHRQLNQGIGSFANQENGKEILGKVFFNEYLAEHFTDVTSAGDVAGTNETAELVSQEGVQQMLLYEMEYLLCGKGSDAENLEEAVKKILGLRVMKNYAYLLTDTTKKAEAETVALSLCALLMVPSITEGVKQAILLSWAYGEGIMDMRRLVAGEKIPLVKSREDWQLQLSNLGNLQGVQKGETEGEQGQGMSYRDYLKGLLLLEDKETLSMRALDLIEGNLGVRLDGCITKLAIKCKCKLRRGIEYEFQTCFGYQ